MKLLSDNSYDMQTYNDWWVKTKAHLSISRYEESFMDVPTNSLVKVKHSSPLDVFICPASSGCPDIVYYVDKLLVVRFKYDNNYGHVLHDLLPMLVYLDKSTEAELIVVASTPMLISLMALHNIEFKKICILEPNSIHLYKAHSYFVFEYLMRCRNSNISAAYKASLDNYLDTLDTAEKKNFLIYCTRNNSSDVLHKRKMTTSVETNILRRLSNFALTHDLEFLIFNGQEDGRTMSHVKQLNLFRRAKVVVGPHGSAMANVVYLDPEIHPIVCEFTSGPRNTIHGKEAFRKNYNFLNSFAFNDLYSYVLLLFDLSSTNAFTSIKIDEFERFLEVAHRLLTEGCQLDT